MAELGIVASIIALVGTGTKLSIEIFDFATTVGGAGRELQTVATEISNLSAVLRQLQGVLDPSHAHFKPTPQAIDSVERIIRHCDAVFKDIGERVASLRGVKDEDADSTMTGFFPTPDFVDRVKWSFKKPKVMEMRSTLEACKSTLNVMLNTMLLAERISKREPSSSAAIDEDDEDKVVTQSLVIAQQCALEQLELYEDEIEKEHDAATAMLLPETHGKHRANVSQRRKSRSRLVRMFSGLSVITDLPTQATTTKPATRADRASLWLDSILAPSDDLDEPHPGQRRQKRLSSAGTASAPFQLLKKWTDQAENLRPSLPPTAPPPPPPPPAQTEQSASLWRDSGFSFATTTQQLPVATVTSLRRASTDLVSPKTESLHSIGWHKKLDVGFEAHHDSSRDSSFDTVLDSVLLDYGIHAMNSQSAALCIYYGGKTKVLKRNEKPIQVLRKYEEMDLEPRLFVRRI